MPWQARRSDKTFRSLAIEAARAALQNAHLRRQDIDLVVYSIFSEVMLRQQIPTLMLQEYLGFQGGSSLRVEAGAATDGYALGAAFAQIRSGRSDVALVLGLQKTSDFYNFETKSREVGYWKGIANATDATWLQPVMPCSEAFLSTIVLNPRIAKYGAPTPEQLAKVVIKNRTHALANSEAQNLTPVTIDDILSSQMIASPITSLMCAQRSDGACGLILASEDRARDMTDKPIWISGTATSSYANNRAEPEHLGRLIGTHMAARKAYKMAGVSDATREFDLAQIHDLVSGIEIAACEELGLCAPGEAGDCLDKGEFNFGSRIPVNVDGGRIGCGHAPGVSGLYAACEIVRQLREEAGARQVPLKNGRGVLQCTDSHGGMNSVSVFARQ